MIDRWRQAVRNLKRELHAITLACGDPRTPWPAKACAVVVVAYALSPLDLIPDPIPVLGYVDDLILLPLGILLVRKLIPVAVMAECRARAAAMDNPRQPANWIAGAVIVLIWLLVAVWLGRWLYRWLAPLVATGTFVLLTK